jgi:hypothetical protein
MPEPQTPSHPLAFRPGLLSAAYACGIAPVAGGSAYQVLSGLLIGPHEGPVFPMFTILLVGTVIAAITVPIGLLCVAWFRQTIPTDAKAASRRQRSGIARALLLANVLLPVLVLTARFWLP